MKSDEELSANSPHGIRRVPKQDRARLKWLQVLEASQQLLVEVGYDRFNIAELSRRSCVGKPTIYQMFSDKEAILGELLAQKSQMVEGMLADAAKQARKKGWRPALASSVRALCAAYRKDPVLDAVFLAAESVRTFRRGQGAKVAAQSRLLAEVLSDVVPIPYSSQLETTAAMIGFMSTALARQAMVTDSKTADRLINETVQMFTVRLESLSRPQ